MPNEVAALSLACLAVAAGLSVAPARADHAPVFVVPGRLGGPIMIGGFDASYAVVEGEWGLSRPGHGDVTVYRPVKGRYAPSDIGYFPASGHAPRRGRLEIEPPANRVLPPPAPTYHRTWSAESDAGPATQYAPYESPSTVALPSRPREHRRHWRP